MNETPGRTLHGKAERAREAGNFLEALHLVDEAFIEYVSENNEVGKADILSSEFLTLRHLFEKTGDIAYMIRAKHSAMCAVELAEKSKDASTLAIPYQRLGSAFATLGEWKEAVEFFKKAFENMKTNPPEPHNRPAVLADMKAHLAHAEYMAGDNTADNRLDEAIGDLKASEELAYNKDVWLSGAYMKGAEMLQNDNPVKSKEYMQKAKEIIDGNPELVLRKGQWEKLNERLAS